MRRCQRICLSHQWKTSAGMSRQLEDYSATNFGFNKKKIYDQKLRVSKELKKVCLLIFRLDCILYQKIVVVHVIDISLADHFVCLMKTNGLVECLSRVLRSIFTIENVHRNS